MLSLIKNELIKIFKKKKYILLVHFISNSNNYLQL